MCLVLFEDGRMEVAIQKIIMPTVDCIEEMVVAAHAHGAHAILTLDSYEVMSRKLKRAGSVRRFLALLEASSRAEKFYCK